MTTYHYQCVNNNCESKEVKLRNFKTSTGTLTRICKDDEFSFQKADGDEEKPEYCPICDEALKRTGMDNPVFLGTSLMSTSQKQQMLMKRSKAHEQTGDRRDTRAGIMEKTKKEFG